MPRNLAHLSAALCLAMLFMAGPARAQESGSFAFAWQAPDGCPGQTEVRSEIARLLGGSIAIPQGGSLRAQAVMTQGPLWSVVIETESAGQVGKRSLEAASCRDLANATALIIALMIDPDAVAAHAAPRPPTPPAPSHALSPNTASQLDYLVGFTVVGSQGTLPSPDVGPGGTLGLAGARWRLELRASYGLRRDQRVSVRPGAYGQFNLTSAQLAGCFNFAGQGVAYGLCADGEVGVVWAKGFGASRALPAQTPWWALGAGGYAVIPLARHWAVPLHLDALVPPRRSEFVFRDIQGNVTAKVFRAAPVGMRVSVGLELQF